MYVKGVVAAMLIAGTLSAHTKSTESLESLFEGAPQGDSLVPYVKFIDIEAFLEAYPEAAKEFKKLPEKDKEKLLESIDLFNEAFSKAMIEILASIEENDASVSE